MSIRQPRQYQCEQDLDAMFHLLQEGRRANNGTYYIHPGDLKWWLYYPPLEGDLWDQIYLWDDPACPGGLLGWALISPDWVGYDVYIHPELRGSDIACEMYIWAEEQAAGVAREKGKPTIYVLWVLRDDAAFGGHLERRGYQLKRGYVHLRRSLEGKLPPAKEAEGFVVRSCRGVAEVTARAQAQFRAFNSTASFEQYLERFTNFMRSPVYDRDLDIIAITPDGQVGAFCIVWIDTETRLGLFEPVGTHPDYHRMGLGRAIMQEGLRRLQARGMRSAIVSTFEDNLAAIKLYESAGFQIINKLGTYEKDV